jgi:alginate O-acetyltransferase complex protein AlgI
MWGLYFGVFMLIEKYSMPVLNKTPRVLKHIYTLILIVFSRSIFYYVDFGQLKEFWRHLFYGRSYLSEAMVMDLYNHAFLLVLAVLLCIPWDEIFPQAGEKWKPVYKWISLTVALAMVAVSTVLLVGDTYNPFIYFRF